MGVVEVALLVVAAVGTVSSIQQQQQARKEQKKARNEQEAMNAERSAAERRQQVREERIRRARIEQSSANTGTTDSSGALGSVGGLGSTLASNLGFNLSQTTHASNISAFNQSAADKLGRAQTYQQLGSLAASGASLFSGAGAATSTAGKSPEIYGPPSYLKNP